LNLINNRFRRRIVKIMSGVSLDTIDFNKFELVPVEPKMSKETKDVLSYIELQINNILFEPLTKSENLILAEHDLHNEMLRRMVEAGHWIKLRSKIMTKILSCQPQLMMLVPKKETPDLNSI
jgi:hypothetical protein